MKKRYWGVGVLLTVVSVVGCVGVTRINAQQSSSMVWSDHQRFATISLGVALRRAGRDIFKAVCTAVLVSTDGRSAYIVTAKHCFGQPSAAGVKQMRVRFAWEQRASQEEDLGAKLPLVDSAGKQLWTGATDGHELAAIPFITLQGGFPPSPSGKIDAIGAQDFGAENDMYDGANVFIYGYPGFVGNNLLTRAITRSGIIAWTNPAGAADNVFLVDAAIFPGNSGGPVFKVPSGIDRTGNMNIGSRVALLGIVTATYKAPIESTNEQQRVEGLGSLGVVEPIAEVRKLLASMGATFPTPTPLPTAVPH